MEEQNRVNEEKDKTSRNKNRISSRKREKVDKEAIRKMGTQGEIATKGSPKKEREKEE